MRIYEQRNTSIRYGNSNTLIKYAGHQEITFTRKTCKPVTYTLAYPSIFMLSYDMHNQKSLYNELINCYDTQAVHFDHTRKKYRQELDHICDVIQENIKEKDSYHITELGCGSGRLYPALKEKIEEVFSYTACDNAPGMIAQAKANYGEHHARWVVADMLTHLRSLPDASQDSIISIASVQHLMTTEQRLLLWQHSYRVLKYGGVFITTNWSYSDWFLKKYRKQQLFTLARASLPGNHR